MAFCYRFFRFTSSICLPVTAIICFSCMLTFVFVLYQPTPGPGIRMRLGWQSWETISESSIQIPVEQEKPVPGSGVPEGVDWWNVTEPAGSVDSSSLPLDVWAPTLPHDTGLSEIAVSRCMFSPELADLCSPPSTSEQDAIKGKWVMVDRNLNLEFTSWYLHIYYRRTRRQDIPLITDVHILPEHETPTPFDASWHKADMSLRDGVRGAPPMFLWYRTGKTLREMTAKERAEDVITELDVLWGEDRPWYGFEKVHPPIHAENEGRMESVWLTYRKGVKPVPKAPPLHFNHAGKFKIMQVADLHYSVSFGSCRDTVLNPCTHSDNLTSSLISRVLASEKPDLVVFTGDQLNGQGTSWDPKSVLAKFAVAVTDMGIPWATVFGNHDEENGINKMHQMKLMKALPYSLVEEGPKDVHGVGNYVLKVKSADASMMHLLTLYFIDSGSYSRGIIDFFGWFTPTAYDWIRQSQIDWFLQESGSINSIERPFTPDSGKDLGNIWKRQAQVTPDTRRLAKPNALMFFHIPLQESYSPADMDPSTGARLDKGMHGNEGPGAAKKSDGFFEKGLLKAMESDHRAGGNMREVKVVANGHCHVTDNCRRVKGVWLCFGGGGSYSGYSRIGFDRRFRIYDISDYGETIRTYKRTEHDDIVDEMVLAGQGAAPYEGT